MAFNPKHLIPAFLLLAGCSSAPKHQADPRDIKRCAEVVEKAALKAHLGEPPRLDYMILGTNYLGLANRRLGGLRLHAYSVEISDEADGALMVVMAEMPKCVVHSTTFTTHALKN